MFSDITIFSALSTTEVLVAQPILSNTVSKPRVCVSSSVRGLLSRHSSNYRSLAFQELQGQLRAVMGPGTYTVLNSVGKCFHAYVLSFFVFHGVEGDYYAGI